jgi:hypothetical protein
MKYSFFIKGIFLFTALVLIPFTTLSFTLMQEDIEGKGMMVYELRLLDIQEETLSQWNLSAGAIGLPMEAPDTFFVEMNDLGSFDLSTERILATVGDSVNYSQFRTDFHPSVVTVPGENANIKIYTENIKENTKEKSGFTFSVTPKDFNYQNGAPTHVILKGEGRLNIDLDTVIDVNVGDWKPIAIAVTTERKKKNIFMKSDEYEIKYRYAIVYLGMYMIQSSKDLDENAILSFSNTGIDDDPFFKREEPIKRESFAQVTVSKHPTPTEFMIGGEIQYIVNDLLFFNACADYSISTDLEHAQLGAGIMLDEGFALKPSFHYGATSTQSATPSMYIQFGFEDVTKPSDYVTYYAGMDFVAYDLSKGATTTAFFFPLDWKLGVELQTEGNWLFAAQIDGFADFTTDIWDNLLPRGLTVKAGYSFGSPVWFTAGVKLNREQQNYYLVPFISARMGF